MPSAVVGHGINESNIVYLEDVTPAAIASGANGTTTLPESYVGNGWVPLSCQAFVISSGTSAGNRVWQKVSLTVVSFDENTGILTYTAGAALAAGTKLVSHFLVAA